MVPIHTFSIVRRFRSAIFLTVFLFCSPLLFATIPSGYYNSAIGTGATMKTSLYNIIKGHTAKTYDYLWTAFYTTDDKPNGKVWDMYSDIPGGTPPYEYTFGTDQCGTAGAEGDCYSREHSFPKSWFGGEIAPMYTDLFHIVPTDQYVNNMRSDHPYGKVTAPTWTSLNGSKRGPCATPGYTGTVFEPRDEYKGDFARNYFYMATRYENVIAGWQNYSLEGKFVLNGTSYPCYYSWFIDLLLEWSAKDTVSQKELDRNDAVYAIQHNRNPYIDHPEYVAAVWTPGIPLAATQAATNIIASGATLKGTVFPNSVATSYHFEWGTTPSYGFSTTDISVGSGSANVSVNAAITGLTPGTIYHYRLVAVYSGGTNNGVDATLTTLIPTLSVTPSNQNVTSAAGSTSFSVTSNSSWTVSSNKTWCTVITTSGTGNGTITVNDSINPTIVQRVANITVNVPGLSAVVVTVTQAAGAPALAVTPSNRNVIKTAGSTTFSVSNNTDWTTSSDQTWCTPTASGTGDGTITANYTENLVMSSRVANITVTATGVSLPIIVTVTQATASSLPEPTNFPTNFSTYNIRIQWTDATGGVIPEAYLVRMSSIGFSSIPDPVDGIPIPNSFSDKNVLAGIQEATFGNLTPNTTYYFKIYSYGGVGSGIAYKTDGVVPQVQKTTQP